MALSAGAPRSRGRGGTLEIAAAARRSRDSAGPPPFELLTASNPSPFTLAGSNTYVLRGSGDTTAVIDPGPDDGEHIRRVLDHATANRRRIGLVLVTHGHSDHRGGAVALAREAGVVVREWRGAGRAALRDGERLDLDGERLLAMHTPGHADDHVVFFWDDRGILFSGDLILGQGTVNVTPPGGSMAAYLRSLERVEQLPLTLIAPGHGPLIHDPHARIAEYRAHRLMREQQVLTLLEAGPRGVGELEAVIYPSLDPRLRGAAEGTLTAHLEKLIDEGRVRRTGARFALAEGRGGFDGGTDRH